MKNYPKEISIRTMLEWIKSNAVTIEEMGNENVYLVDQFGNEFYCKCL